MKHDALLSYIATHPHHAYIVRGAFPKATLTLRDCYLVERDVLRIEDVRFLRASASRINESSSIILLRAQAILVEAQHALLKALEEPVEGLIYLMHVRTAHSLLSTLISRCCVIDMSDPCVNPEIENFLSLSLRKRMDYIAQAVESEGHGDAYALLENLLRERKTQTLLTAYRAVSRHPLGLRQILEHFALTLKN